GGKRQNRAAPRAKEEGLLDLFGACNEVGHDKGRSQGKDLPARLELDPPHRHLLFTRAISIMKGIPAADCLWKQFRVLCAQLRQILTIFRHVFHTPLIVRFTLKRHADMFVATGWGLLLHLCAFHHYTVWNIVALPSL